MTNLYFYRTNWYDELDEKQYTDEGFVFADTFKEATEKVVDYFGDNDNTDSLCVEQICADTDSVLSLGHDSYLSTSAITLIRRENSC